MARAVVECSQCGQKLSVPQKKGEVECPKYMNLITLKFEPKVVYTPPWLNKRLGLLLILLALWLWNNVMWFRTYAFGNAQLLEGLAQLLCFAGIMVVALADTIRNRGRFIGEQAHPNPSIHLHKDGDTASSLVGMQVTPEFGTKFYLAIIVPLLMIPLAFLVPLMLDWCRHPAFRECNEVDDGAYFLMLLMPFATALAVMTMGAKGPENYDNEILAGAKISAVLTFAFFAILSFMMLTIHP